MDLFTNLQQAFINEVSKQASCLALRNYISLENIYNYINGLFACVYQERRREEEVEEFVQPSSRTGDKAKSHDQQQGCKKRKEIRKPSHFYNYFLMEPSHLCMSLMLPSIK